MSCTWMSQEFRDSMGYFTYTNIPSTCKWDILGVMRYDPYNPLILTFDPNFRPGTSKQSV